MTVNEYIKSIQVISVASGSSVVTLSNRENKSESSAIKSASVI